MHVQPIEYLAWVRDCIRCSRPTVESLGKPIAQAEVK